jgi:hypothetical protein
VAFVLAMNERIRSMLYPTRVKESSSNILREPEDAQELALDVHEIALPFRDAVVGPPARVSWWGRWAAGGSLGHITAGQKS